jgi:hypothetical protein
MERGFGVVWVRVGSRGDVEDLVGSGREMGWGNGNRRRQCRSVRRGRRCVFDRPRGFND